MTKIWPTNFHDGLVTNLLDVHLPLAPCGGLHDHLPQNRAKVRPEGFWEREHLDPRRH
jgi:hypothetical protein